MNIFDAQVIFDWFVMIADVFNKYEIFGVPILLIWVALILTSMVITVFWKGARG